MRLARLVGFGVIAAFLVTTVTALAANAAPLTYTATLSGAAESPPNASPGTGNAQVDLDVVAHTLRVQVVFSGLLGNTTASHVHAPTAVAGIGTAGVATQLPTFTGFPLGVTSGTYDHTFDTLDPATWSAAFVTNSGGTALGAEAVFAQALSDGRAYLNVHSQFATGGEIRGFLDLIDVTPTATGTWGRIKALYR